MYQPFSAKKPTEYILCPYLLKLFRKMWFLFSTLAPGFIATVFANILSCAVTPNPTRIRMKELLSIILKLLHNENHSNWRLASW